MRGRLDKMRLERRPVFFFGYGRDFGILSAMGITERF